MFRYEEQSLKNALGHDVVFGEVQRFQRERFVTAYVNF